jgi:hypothetical protein
MALELVFFVQILGCPVLFLTSLYILKWDAVGSILKQTKRKHQLTIKTCIKYLDKKSPVK